MNTLFEVLQQTLSQQNLPPNCNCMVLFHLTGYKLGRAVILKMGHLFSLLNFLELISSPFNNRSIKNNYFKIMKPLASFNGFQNIICEDTAIVMQLL